MQQQQQQNKPVVRRKQKMDSSLNEERIKELNDIGFVWEIPCSSLEDKKFNKKLVEEAALAAKVSETPSDENALWTLRFEQLKLFQAHTGHCLVPKSCPVNPELSRVSVFEFFHDEDFAGVLYADRRSCFVFYVSG